MKKLLHAERAQSKPRSSRRKRKRTKKKKEKKLNTKVRNKGGESLDVSLQVGDQSIREPLKEVSN